MTVSFSSLEETRLDQAWLTIGVFDGLHRGHQEILQRLIRGAHSEGAPAVVLTFAPHPAVVLGGRTDFKWLTPPAERLARLEALGVDAVITQTFDRTFADQTAEAFMQRVKDCLGLKKLVIGYDTALGRGRQGDAARLAEIGQRLDYQVETVPALADREGAISSTRVRRALASGDIAGVAAMLGRSYSVNGPVVHGDGRGHTIQVPTANLQIPPEKLLPINGIYSTWAILGKERIPAATNVGVRPTFTPDLPAPTVEAHLLDFDRNLYGQPLELEFVAYLRPEARYEKLDDLIAQIQVDILQTRKSLIG